MKIKKTIFSILGILTFLLFLPSQCAAKTGKIVSPNGKINISIETKNTDNDGYGQVYFSVGYRKNGLVKTVFSPINLGLKTELQDLGSELKLVSVSPVKNIEDDYTMITGKRSHCINRALERTYQFVNRQGQTIDIAFRAYNDGVAFKYSIQSSNNEKEFITEELTSYPIPEGTKRWMQQYKIDYEGFFPLKTDGNTESNNAHLWGYPALFESALQHMPDRPDSYRSLPDPVKQFLSKLPTAWDDTKLLGGYPAEETIIARKKSIINIDCLPRGGFVAVIN